MDHRMFLTMPLGKLFFRCALPSIISMAISSLYVMVDGVFVGRYIGADALAAINLVMPAIMISFALSDMIAVGSSVQVAIHLGQGETERARQIFSFSSLLIVGISCVVGALGYFGAESMVRLMGANEAVTALSAQYMRCYAVFAPVIMIFFALDNYLRICGKPIYSMAINIGMSVVNIALDWLFIAHLGYGVWSAALASCISLALGTLVGLAPFLRGRLTLRFCRPHITAHIVRNIVANGSSELFSNISSSVFMVLLNTALLRISGSQAVAAFSIVLYIDSFVSSMLFGMVDSLQPAISCNYGAKQEGRMYGIEKRVMLAGAILCISVMLLMRIGHSAIIPFFIQENDTVLLTMATRAMMLFSFSYLFSWVGTACSGFFTALNRPGLSLLLSFAQTLVFPLAALLVLPALIGLDGIWLTAFAAKFLTAVLSAGCLIWLRRANRRSCKP